jgi:hypothetical protein
VVGEPILVAQDADKEEIEAARVRIDKRSQSDLAPMSPEPKIAHPPINKSQARSGLTLAAYQAFTQVAALAPVMLMAPSAEGRAAA